MVAEASLKGDENGRCLERAFCMTGTKRSLPTGSMDKGVADTYDIIREVMETVPESEVILSRMSKVKTSFEVGFKTQDEEICRDIYP